jgi:hypothetical protein
MKSKVLCEACDKVMEEYESEEIEMVSFSRCEACRQYRTCSECGKKKLKPGTHAWNNSICATCEK